VKLLNKILVLLVFFFLLSSCLEEFKDTDKIKSFKWEPQVAIPLINSSFNFLDFVENSTSQDYVYSDANGVITFAYQDTVHSKTGESIYALQNQGYQKSEEIPYPIASQILAEDSIVFRDKIIFNFSTKPGREIDSVLLKSGLFDFQTNWNFDHPGKLFVNFSSLSLNSDTLKTNYVFNNSSNPYDFSADLADYLVNLTDGGTSFNVFVMDFTWVIYKNGFPLPNPTTFDLNAQITQPEFIGIFGELGSESISTDQSTTKLDAFSRITDGTLELDDPKAIVTLINSFGVTSEVLMDDIRMTTNQGLQKLQGAITTNPITIDAISYSNLGSSSSTKIEINKQNSNIQDLIAGIPQEILYGFNGSLAGTNQKEFVLDTSALTVLVKLELPLKGKIIGLTANETYDFNGSDISSLKNVIMQVKSINTFPFDIKLQVYFLNDLKQIVDILIKDDNNIITASENDIEGNVILPGEKTLINELDAVQLDNISTATSLRLEAIINTTQAGTIPVTVLDSHNLSITIGVQATLDPINN